jgi:hypothetical protein
MKPVMPNGVLHPSMNHNNITAQLAMLQATQQQQQQLQYQQQESLQAAR